MGQNGGNGADGQSPEVDFLLRSHVTAADLKCKVNLKKFKSRNNYEQIDSQCDNGLFTAMSCNAQYVFRGICTRQAGVGGRGGFAGFNGDIRIFELGTKSNITLVLEAEANGEDGYNGREGENLS